MISDFTPQSIHRLPHPKELRLSAAWAAFVCAVVENDPPTQTFYFERSWYETFDHAYADDLQGMWVSAALSNEAGFISARDDESPMRPAECEMLLTGSSGPVPEALRQLAVRDTSWRGRTFFCWFDCTSDRWIAPELLLSEPVANHPICLLREMAAPPALATWVREGNPGSIAPRVLEALEGPPPYKLSSLLSIVGEGRRQDVTRSAQQIGISLVE